jgi:hypothetical protein
MDINESEQHIWVIPCDEDNHSLGLSERQGLQVIVGAGWGFAFHYKGSRISGL